jgi:hypothetical protein
LVTLMKADRLARLVAIMRGNPAPEEGVTDVTGVTVDPSPHENAGYEVTPVTPCTDIVRQSEPEAQEEEQARNHPKDPDEALDPWWRDPVELRARYDEIAAIVEFDQGNSRDVADRIAMERLIEVLKDYGLTENEALELVKTKLGLPFIVFR